MDMKTLPVSVSLCLAFGLAGGFVARAQSASGDAAANLQGTWQLVRFQGGDDKTLVPPDKSKYTLRFAADGTVAARIDCNRGHGTWKSSGPQQLEFGPMALTRAMCPAAALNDRLPKDLGYVRSYVLKDGHLFLSLMADGGSYEFEPAAKEGEGARDSKSTEPRDESSVEAATASLENTYWKLIALGETKVPALPREPQIVLNSQTHRVEGSGGCNRVAGSYELSGHQIRFNQMASTMMACPQGMETEKEFLNALNQAKTWKIAGSRLELFGGDGHSIAKFESGSMK
jgi:heat shock protein HslJ